MQKYQIIIEPKAKEHLEDLFDFYEQYKSGRGSEFLASFVEFMETIEKNPARRQYLHTIEAGIRRAIIFSPPVVILYKIVDDTIYISDIIDSRSDWKRD